MDIDYVIPHRLDILYGFRGESKSLSQAERSINAFQDKGHHLIYQMRITRQDEMKMIVHDRESYDEHFAGEQICCLGYDVHHQYHIVVINKNDRGLFTAGVHMPAGKTFQKSRLTTSFFLAKTSHFINTLCVRMAFLRTKHHFYPLRASERRFHARPDRVGGGGQARLQGDLS